MKVLLILVIVCGVLPSGSGFAANGLGGRADRAAGVGVGCTA